MIDYSEVRIMGQLILQNTYCKTKDAGICGAEIVILN